MVCGFVWVALSFYWFVNQNLQTSKTTLADTNIQSAYEELTQTSEDLRFKLGQWAYNYHLVKTKGVDFDQDGFLASEFDDIYFFKLEETDLKTQWIKSKDMAAAVVPSGLSAKLKEWSKEDLLKKNFIYFTENIKTKGSKVFFGFPISDEVMGEGVILSSLDLDYVQLISPHLNVYLLDSKGRFLYHPQKEYVGQSPGSLVKSDNKNIFVKTSSVKSIDGEFIYRVKMDGVLAQTIWPTLVMFLGLALVFGILIFEIYMQAPLNIPTSITNMSDQSSSLDKDEYGSILKLNEVRELLNKMSLSASVLKGRLDLATNGELDQKLFEDIKEDFENLDRTIELAYQKTQLIESDSTREKEAVKARLQAFAENPAKASLTEAAITTELTGDDDTRLGVRLGALQEAAQILKDQDLSSDFDMSDDNFKEEDLQTAGTTKDESESEETFGAFEDIDFEDLNFESDLIAIDDESHSETWDDLLEDSGEDSQNKGVVFQEYIGPETEVNDWAKIIEELTEEINTAELKPTVSKQEKDSEIRG